MTDHDLFQHVAAQAAAFRDSLPGRSIPAPDPQLAQAAFGGPLPEQGAEPEEVINQLIAAAEPGLVASPGPRFFGFVVGGALPAAAAADMLATGWDQCAFNSVLSPAAQAAETAAGGWLKDVLGLPAGASVGFVTGAQAANTVGLACGRDHVFAEAGYDVARSGLVGAPRVRVLASQERHATIDRSLRLLGLGTDVIEAVRTDANGAMDMADLARVVSEGPAGVPMILCLQAGNVNTGAIDDLRTGCELGHQAGAWVHVDGAFGLWAAANPATASLLDGADQADSWCCDGHKWLNVPYDSAFAIVSRPELHQRVMSYRAAYLVGSRAEGEMADYTPESSRRARGFAVWAALRQLGRAGLADLIARNCALTRQFADGLAAAGFEIGNDVVLNQALVSFGDDEHTGRVIAAVQNAGVCWFGGTTWRDRAYMRIAVSNYATTQADVDRCVEHIVAVAAATA